MRVAALLLLFLKAALSSLVFASYKTTGRQLLHFNINHFRSNNMKDYFNHPEIKQMLATLAAMDRQQPEGKKVVSDIVDDAGYQYVDLVMEGGGTLGVALLGYIYILEQQGIRFLRLAGTSAGSIVAVLLAGGGPIDQPRSEWLTAAVAGKDFSDFIDGDEAIQDFIDGLLSKDRRKVVQNSKVAVETLKTEYGLNPGLEFMRWMAGLLHEQNIFTWTDLEKQRSSVPQGLRRRSTGQPVGPDRFRRVSVVAADVTTQTKAVLPDMAPLYWAEPHTVNPADYVRASMSVPVFFYPLRTQWIPQDAEAGQRWSKMANYHGPVPPEVLFVDGGCLSNFPLSLFSEDDPMPGAPAWGIKMGLERDSCQPNESFGQFAGALLGAMMYWADNDFLVRHPEERRHVGIIDTGPHNWLDFSLSDADKQDLFVRGARAATSFLMGY
jgi:NTE family protein